jgi:ribosomal protein L40E
MENFGDQIVEILNQTTPFLFNNATLIFNLSITIIIFLLLLFWLFSGLNLYKDIKSYYHLEFNVFIRILVIICLLLAGPLGVVIFNIVKPKITNEEIDLIKIEHKFFYHQASKVLDCVNCGSYVLENHAYCTNCGWQNRFNCKKCNALNNMDAKYCYSCGTQIEKKSKSLPQNKEVQNKKNNETELKDNLNKLILIIRDFGNKFFSKASIVFFKIRDNTVSLINKAFPQKGK